jgi:hypothetical protein
MTAFTSGIVTPGKQDQAVSEYFFDSYVKLLKVRKVTSHWFCPRCDNYHSLLTKETRTKEEEAKLKEGEAHLALTKKIKKLFQEELDTLDLDTLLIQIDFTKHDHKQHSFQDLIVVIQKKKEGGTGREREYRHYIGEEGEKNDVCFVIRVFKDLLAASLFKNYKKVIIWSDGARKHFKQTGFEVWLSFLQEELRKTTPDLVLQHKFFPSYHGSGLCDVAASHSKQE